MKLDELVKLMRANTNPENIPDMERYMRNQFPFLGIQSVQRRKLAQKFQLRLRKEARTRAANADTTTNANEAQAVIDWETVLDLWELPEREFQLVALDYLKSTQHYLSINDLPYLEKIIKTKSWWDTVDALAKVVGALVQNEYSMQHVMKDWSQAENLWLRRTSILHQLAFKNQTNVPLLSEIILNNIHSDEFFIQKAIGWILREYAKTEEQWVVDFTEKYRTELSALSYREARKNIRLN